MVTPPEVPASRGHFYSDLQDKSYRGHRMDNPCGGRVLAGPSAPSLGWLAAMRARPFALALPRHAYRV